MNILVSDTSILIDLERGGLLESAFSCGLTMVVPDLLYEKELANHNGPYLRTLGLGVVALTSEEVIVAQRVRAERPALSVPDCFALCCALRPDHALVTGDKALRTEATTRVGVAFGLLWLLDQMSASNAISTTVLHDGLSAIAAHQRCRLPQDEVRARLIAWRAAA